MSCRTQCPGNPSRPGNPGKLCDCTKSADLLSPSIVLRIENAQKLMESGEEGQMIHDIMSITNPHEFTRIRDDIRERYGVIFLVKGDGGIIMENSPGLCRKIRPKIRKALNGLLSENTGLLIGILNRDSMFDDRNFLDNIGYEQEN